MGYQMDLDAGGGGGLGGSFEQGFEFSDNPTTGIVPE
jgi:hypothetical protein